jgi:hypothetical protein
LYPETMETPAVKTRSAFPAEPSTIEGWAALQGVQLVTDFESFLGHPSPEDETDEEFAAMLHQWRNEGPSQKPNR